MIYHRMAYPRAHDAANQATNDTNSMHLLNNDGTVLKLQLRPSIYMVLFLRNA